MKKVLLIFTFLITFIFTTVSALADGNYLHTITLERNDNGYNVILGSDKVTKVTKKSPKSNELVLEMSGIESSESVNALYKGTSNIDWLVIENTAPNKLKISITASDIGNSTVIIDPINGSPSIVGEKLPMDKILWCVFVLALVGVIVKLSKSITEEEEGLNIRNDIKTREIQMYKKYRKDISISPTYAHNGDARLKTMVKKIDRKIDERLLSNIK